MKRLRHREVRGIAPDHRAVRGEAEICTKALCPGVHVR
jgi:hypothetical protein